MTLLTKPSVKTAASDQQERSNIMYSINPASYSSVFVLPTEIADKHLRMAGKAQLKVLLWLYRNPSAEFELGVISRETGIPTDEIDDAMLYWIDAGLVVKKGENPAVSQPVTAAAEEKKTVVTPGAFNVTAPVHKNNKKPEPEAGNESVYVKPTVRDVSMRLSESPEIAALFNEVQEVFGRTLGHDAQANLLILHDHYGLSAEAIVMLCSYAKTIGKQGALSYIMHMGKSWAEQGITDFESASRKISRLESTSSVWEEFRVLTGIENPRPTSKQSELLEIWTGDFGYGTDMIHRAYEITVEKKGKISYGYMNGILSSWHSSGFRTVAETAAAETEFNEGTKNTKKSDRTSSAKGAKSPSYDIELAMKNSLKLDPANTKKGT